MYKSGTQFGRINTSYTRSQFRTCEENLIQLENVPDMEWRYLNINYLYQEGRGIKDALVKPSAVAADVLAIKEGQYVIRRVIGVFLVQISNFTNLFYISILRLQFIS